MEIAHLSSVHIADDTRIYQKMCKYLVKEGWNVTLIARKPQNQLSDQIKFIRFPEFKGKFSRMLFSPLIMLYFAFKHGKKHYQIHDPELIPTGLMLKLFGKKIVLDVHEHYQDQIMGKDYAGSLQKTLLSAYVRYLEKLASVFFDQIITVTPGIQQHYPANKCTLVQNFAIKDELSQKSDITPFQERANTIYYVGNLTTIRGVGEVIDAMDLIPDHYGAKFIIAGSFGEPGLYEEYKSKPGWRNVEYLGFQSREAIQQTMSQVKAGVVMLHPEKQYIGAQSIKMFEYMSASLPVIAADMPMMDSVIKETGAGLLVEPFNIEMLSQSIMTIFDDPERAEMMGKSGCKAVRDLYNWESQYKIYRSVLEKL